MPGRGLRRCKAQPTWTSCTARCCCCASGSGGTPCPLPRPGKQRASASPDPPTMPCGCTACPRTRQRSRSARTSTACTTCASPTGHTILPAHAAGAITNRHAADSSWRKAKLALSLRGGRVSSPRGRLRFPAGRCVSRVRAAVPLADATRLWAIRKARQLIGRTGTLTLCEMRPTRAMTGTCSRGSRKWRWPQLTLTVLRPFDAWSSAGSSFSAAGPPSGRTSARPGFKAHSPHVPAQTAAWTPPVLRARGGAASFLSAHKQTACARLSSACKPSSARSSG